MRVPLTVRTVADVIGMDAAVRLMQVAYTSPHTDGGSKLYVPAREIAGHRLARVLQPHELKAITRAFGGELLSYPSARGIKRRIAAQRKAEAIMTEINAGLSTVEIAAKHKVSTQYVRRIRTKGTTSSARAYPRKRER
jgi:hypothetical protein